MRCATPSTRRVLVALALSRGSISLVYRVDASAPLIWPVQCRMSLILRFLKHLVAFRLVVGVDFAQAANLSWQAWLQLLVSVACSCSPGGGLANGCCLRRHRRHRSSSDSYCPSSVAMAYCLIVFCTGSHRYSKRATIALRSGRLGWSSAACHACCGSGLCCFGFFDVARGRSNCSILDWRPPLHSCSADSVDSSFDVNFVEVGASLLYRSSTSTCHPALRSIGQFRFHKRCYVYDSKVHSDYPVLSAATASHVQHLRQPQSVLTSLCAPHPRAPQSNDSVGSLRGHCRRSCETWSEPSSMQSSPWADLSRCGASLARPAFSTPPWSPLFALWATWWDYFWFPCQLWRHQTPPTSANWLSLTNLASLPTQRTFVCICYCLPLPSRSPTGSLWALFLFPAGLRLDFGYFAPYHYALAWSPWWFHLSTQSAT